MEELGGTSYILPYAFAVTSIPTHPLLFEGKLFIISSILVSITCGYLIYIVQEIGIVIQLKSYHCGNKKVQYEELSETSQKTPPALLQAMHTLLVIRSSFLKLFFSFCELKGVKYNGKF